MAGAEVVRGVRDVTLGEGRPRTVSYRVGEEVHQITAPLVVGADGRASTVRKQTGIELERSPAMNYIAGLLLDDLDGVPDGYDVMVGEGDLFFILFHQGGGRARTYLATGLADKHRFSGRGSTERYLDAIRFASYPLSDSVASGTPAGPCAAYAGDDTWTRTPYADGVVLIGDAAGYNDPIIGEGLSIAMRDTRTVRDLVLDGATEPDDFRGYADERVERMRRLRLIAVVISVVQVEDGGDRRARRTWFGEKMGAMDPEIFPLVVGAFVGPENVPDELVDEGILDRIRSEDHVGVA
jgi:2-polyprenyl-6-methoxyphenol hydroxylase-like FAD-dependent oxidoreductase